MVSDYMFFGLFLAEEGMGEVVAQIRRLKRVKDDTLGFTLHSDGWVGDMRDRLNGPSHVQWFGSRFCSYSNYGLNYGLKDIKPSPYDENACQHYVVVPWFDWKHNPKILCDYEGDQTELVLASSAIDIDTKHKQGRDKLLDSVFG